MAGIDSTFGGKIPAEKAAPAAPETVRDIIVRVAKELGVDPDLALAMAQQESGLNPNAIGDNGHSVGLFQLNDRGEGAGMSVSQRQDAETNARIALTVVKQVADAHPDYSPGQIAAAAQRPADPTGYASSVNSILGNGGATGGNNVPSVSSGGAPDRGPVPYVDPTDYARSNYGFLAGYLDDPEIGPILKKAGQEQWDLPKLEGALYKTDWWKNNSVNMRQWGALKATDPATANQQMEEFKSQLDTEAQKLGVQLKPEDLNWWADHYLALGKTPTDPFIQKELVRVYTTRPDLRIQNAGDIAAIGSQVRSTAANYFRNLTQQDIDWWSAQIASGAADINGFENVMRTQASDRFATYKDQILNGATPAQLFADRRDAIAKTLEVSPDTIDLANDPRWSQVLSSAQSDGTFRPMTYAETLQMARSQHEFRGTVQGQQSAADTAEFIDREFGKVMA